MIDTPSAWLSTTEKEHQIKALLYPLRFEPIYQYRLWVAGICQLAHRALPSGPVGEAWLLSDRDDHQSRVTDGPLKGQSIGQLLQQFPKQIMGKLAGVSPDSPCC